MAGNKGSEGDARTREAEREDNVIRFPRDWFGPVEDLVPIGPRATAAAVSDTRPVRTEASPSAVEPAAPADEAAPSPAADDFWGEGSAAVQQLVEAPETVAVPAIRWRGPRIGLPRARAMAVAAAGAVLVVASGAIEMGGHHGRAASARAALGSLSETAGAGAGRDRLPVLRLSAAVMRPLHRRARARISHDSRLAGARRTVSVQSSSSPSRAAEVTPVSDTPSVSSGSSSSYSSSPPAGPVGPGAAFAPGQMG